MVKIKTDSKVYVLCPANVITGGVELMHQLVDFLNNHQRLAYVVYFGESNLNVIPDAYKKYNIQVSDKAPDEESSCIVFPEGFLYMSQPYKKAQKIFWWMSVDNFYKLSGYNISLKDIFEWDKRRFFIESARRVLKRKEYIGIEKISIADLINVNAINAYQSEYARLFLSNHRFTNLVPLSDYINQEYLTVPTDNKKEKVVLYNPKKGFAFTKRIMDSAPEIKWTPLVNLTREQMREKLTHSMVYVDFGNHPGKDRIPREAAMSGCCIITGKRGAAGNPVDVMIPSHYKYDDNQANISAIVKCIRDIFGDYGKCFEQQKEYREKIKNEKSVFESEIASLFGL